MGRTYAANTARDDEAPQPGRPVGVFGTTSATDRSGRFAYRYTIGKLLDLQRVSEGDEPWEFSYAEGINNSGMICGRGKAGKRRNYRGHGFLLIPNSP